jgi:hypothetical protein
MTRTLKISCLCWQIMKNAIKLPTLPTATHKNVHGEFPLNKNKVNSTHHIASACIYKGFRTNSSHTSPSIKAGGCFLSSPFCFLITVITDTRRTKLIMCLKMVKVQLLDGCHTHTSLNSYVLCQNLRQSHLITMQQWQKNPNSSHKPHVYIYSPFNDFQPIFSNASMWHVSTSAFV